MLKLRTISKPIDVWGSLQTIFEGSSKELSEIYFVNMTSDQLVACLMYLLSYSREVNSRFRLSGTDVAVNVASPESAIRAIVSGEVSAAIMVDFPGLPALVIHIEDPQMMSLCYIREQWNPCSAIALFDLMNQLVTIAPNAEIVPDAYQFTPDEQTTFMEVWQEFHSAAK
ncbi:MAG: hypothetical protein Q9P01_14655 [Anaerolineae bacterium]|nr:hypothetical protein [Anaerolineae bacterium]